MEDVSAAISSRLILNVVWIQNDVLAAVLGTEAELIKIVVFYFTNCRAPFTKVPVAGSWGGKQTESERQGERQLYFTITDNSCSIAGMIITCLLMVTVTESSLTASTLDLSEKWWRAPRAKIHGEMDIHMFICVKL